jgi:hypothetical protein
MLYIVHFRRVMRASAPAIDAKYFIGGALMQSADRSEARPVQLLT